MMMDTINPPVSAALLNRVEALQATAEYIETLVEIVGQDVRRMRRAKADPTPIVPIEDVDDWRVIEVLLALVSDQTEIVREVALAVERSRFPGTAALN